LRQLDVAQVVLGFNDVVHKAPMNSILSP